MSNRERIATERDRVNAALASGEVSASQHDQLYAVQQALCWVDDPEMARSPFDTVTQGPITVISPSWGTLAS